MKSLNRVQLIGYLGKDPVVRELEGGRRLAIMLLATSTFHQSKEGERIQDTEWHTVKVWGGASSVEHYRNLIKGSHIMIEGQLVYNTYKDKNGQTHRVAEIKAITLIDLDR